MVEYTYYLLIGAVLFVLGLVGFVTRRNLILMFLCTELMLQGVILTLVGFNRHWLSQGAAGLDGQSFTIFLLVIAAAEAALAMALVMVLQRYKPTLDAAAFSEMKG
ncbi:MAG: NADH-quinone oxidoreductase subunit NuoK [Planctomycetes bacterium]|nr:NADH-quinone oxidoreductase subunit NuoK [Planctomycetota bacterium]